MGNLNKIVLIAGVIFFTAQLSMAAENESWMQKLKKRFFVKEKPRVEEKAKTTPEKADLKTQKLPEVKKETAAPKAAKRKPIAEMTRAEMLGELKRRIEIEEDILKYVPEIKKKKDPDGNVSYVYQAGVQEIKFEDLEEEQLRGLLSKVSSVATKLNTERIQRQLELTRQRAGAVSGSPRVPAIPKTPPATAPSYRTPTQPPKVPSVPSAASQTRR
ncbi:MAG: hypothetical protein PHP46_06130 [Candidatus Omnitrophica bacterium]|nr:hypothetical protein [Candidatus Omnitrophota bacterium]